MVEDPLEWPWSTHRDLVGARLEPWLTTERLSDAFGLDDADALAALRALVTPRVESRKGTLPWAPSLAKPLGLPQIVHAADAACLYVPRSLRNSVLVHLAHAHGFVDPGLLADHAGVSRPTVERILRSARPPGLEQAELCALDARLVYRPELRALVASKAAS